MTAEARVTPVPSAPANMDARTRRLLEGPLPRTLLELAAPNALVMVNFVIVHGRFSGHGRAKSWIAADILRIVDGVLVEHWDVLQGEASEAESQSGLPMFGSTFPA